MDEESYGCRVFSLGNPREDGATDLPRLLRRVADEMERLHIDPMDVLDLTIQQEMTEVGPWWSASVYWSPDAPVEEAVTSLDATL